MQFWDFPTGWPELKRTGLAQRLGYKRIHDVVQHFMARPQDNALAYRHGLFLQGWLEESSPYYNVYPCIIPPLSKISLDFPGNMVTYPNGIKNLVLRMPKEGHALYEGDVVIRSIFISFQPVTKGIGAQELGNGMVIGLDFGETEPILEEHGYDCQMPIHTMKIFPLDERNVSQTLWELPMHESFEFGKRCPTDLVVRCCNLAIAVCMLPTDEDILEPEYLNCDLSKVTPETSDKYQRRAIQRGKFGFNLGRHMEVIPHYRRPHPALMWTGQGRHIPKIVFRSGSLIHREIVNKIPTGKEHADG